ncbi:hypothetical protein DNTS_002058 [Danionella cerebrum]|uniref:Ig-like domain-containing protein n=1 Tax=Danionella cerebrum TaxID=2873325 RepID=A0A553MZ39_9TELE|nr:hypothetical protein DNTS_002058 [Danionella translucida]
MSEGKKRERNGRKRGGKKGHKESIDPTRDVAPSLKRMKTSLLVDEGSRLMVKCEATGNPTPEYKWYKDGTELKKSKEIRIRNGNGNSDRQCKAGGFWELHMCGREYCGEGQWHQYSACTEHNYNVISRLGPRQKMQRHREDILCPNDYTGDRCQTSVMASFYQAEELYQKRVLTITGICVALLVVGIVCVVAYCKTKKQRKKMHNHLRQNIYVDHPNRNLANGPNHPGPGPEEIPMYISKNLPATERVIRHGADAPFPGSRQSSRSHNSSTRAHSSTHRHEGRTWSLERTDSVLSDCPSGMISSSVGTSKCNSPACMEARARRAAHCGFTEPHRPAMQYGDSFDSLGDSPRSDRYVSALTTPARLSPVDFHYSLSQQVPTFQITSPNASHAMSLPPAAHTPYPPEEDQPLLRRYQVPLHEARGHEPYRQQQHGSYLRDSTGSLPSSPYRLALEEEYESTQEYLASMEQPKRNNRRWRRSRLNGHVAPRDYQPSRDLGSRTCMSESDSEEEDGESTPFLSMQNMNAAEPPHPPQTRVRHADFSRPERAVRVSRQHTEQTGAYALRTGQRIPLERPPTYPHKKRSTADMHL